MKEIPSRLVSSDIKPAMKRTGIRIPVAVQPQALPDLGKIFYFSIRSGGFFFGKLEHFANRLELIAAVLRQLLNDITEFRAALVTGAGRLPLASAAGSFGVFAPAAHQSVAFILVISF